MRWGRVPHEALRCPVAIEPWPESSSEFERLLANAILTGPAFTIRGGTNEILKNRIAAGLLRRGGAADG